MDPNKCWADALAALTEGRNELYAEGRRFCIIMPDGHELALRPAQAEAGILRKNNRQ